MKTDIKLIANVDTGEGHIKIMPHFDKMYTLWQVDVLGDWIYDLETLYDERMAIWKKEMKEVRDAVQKKEPVGPQMFRVKPECSIMKDD